MTDTPGSFPAPREPGILTVEKSGPDVTGLTSIQHRTQEVGMNNRLSKYSLAAGLALLLAIPAVAHSQYNAPQVPHLGADGGRVPGNTVPLGELEPQRRQGRFAGAQDTQRGRAPRGATGRPGRGSRGSIQPDRRGNSRGNSRSEFRGAGRNVGRGVGRSIGRGAGRGAGRGGFAAGITGRNSRPSLASHALARADQIGLTDEQRDQITAAQRGVREASINQRAATQIAELELSDLMGAETRDIAAIEAKLRQLAEQRISEQTASLRLDEAVHETPTNEQIDELGDPARDRGRNRGRNQPGRSGGRGRQDAR